MLCREIMKVIEERYPKQFSMDWDNVGLLAGRLDKEIHRIYLALDATDEVIEEAAAWKADMLITHHPMIFKAVKKITDEDFIGRRILRLVREDISYYAMHTNYDIMGMAVLAGEYLGFENASVLEVTCEGKDGMPEEGIGRIADLKSPMSLKECCKFVKERFALPSVKVFGDPDMRVSRLAVFPGSGKGAVSQALEKGADALVTGDIDHHEGIDAVAQNMAVIDAGHYGVEHIFIEDMRRFCEEKFPQLEVRTEKICHPFWVI